MIESSIVKYLAYEMNEVENESLNYNTLNFE